MKKYIAVNALSLPNPNAPDDPNRNLLVRAGTEVELDADAAKACLEVGSIREVEDQDADEDREYDREQQVERLQQDPAFQSLPKPTRGESQAKWLTYANQEYGLDLPPDTRRDEIIAKVEEAEARVGA